MDQSDYYKILQVDPHAELEVIAAIYKKLLRRYGPDGSHPNPQRLAQIEKAYAVLSNPGERARYDAHCFRDREPIPSPTPSLRSSSSPQHREAPPSRKSTSTSPKETPSSPPQHRKSAAPPPSKKSPPSREPSPPPAKKSQPRAPSSQTYKQQQRSPKSQTVYPSSVDNKQTAPNYTVRRIWGIVIIGLILLPVVVVGLFRNNTASALPKKSTVRPTAQSIPTRVLRPTLTPTKSPWHDCEWYHVTVWNAAVRTCPSADCPSAGYYVKDNAVCVIERATDSADWFVILAPIDEAQTNYSRYFMHETVLAPGR